MLLVVMKRYLALIMLISYLLISAPFAVSVTGSELEEQEITVMNAGAEEQSGTYITTEEDIRAIQKEIDSILVEYLGSTMLSVDEIAVLVNTMEWESYQTALQKISEIEESEITQQMTEEEIQSLINNNSIMCNFATLLEKKKASDGQISMFAAKTVTPITGVDVTDSAGTGSLSNGDVTITVRGGLFYSKSNTITVANVSPSKGKLSFHYEASNSESFSLDAENGYYPETTLEAGESITFTITASGGYSTASVVLSDFKLTPVTDSSNVILEYDSAMGSVTVDDVTIESGTSIEISASGRKFVATPKTGVSFLGWKNILDDSLVSTESTCTIEPTVDMTVEAVFISNSSTIPYFRVNKQYLYDNLPDAVEKAKTVSNKVVILANNATLPAGDYEIPSGVTLLIPFDSANTLYTTTPGYVVEANEGGANWSQPTFYRTLTMAQGANMVVNGSISLSAKHSAQFGYNGMPIGDVSRIKMENGSSITLNSGANLYAWGYITGSGSVFAKSGSTVYENFQLKDWRGGSQTTSMRNRVFPMSQYYFQNIEVPLTIESGAKEIGVTTASLTLIGNKTIPMELFAPSGALFNITSGSVTKDYSESSDQLVFEVNGNLVISEYVLMLNEGLIGIGTVSIDTGDFVFPIPSHLKMHAKSGNIAINQDISLYPGSEFIIDSDATITVGNGYEIYIYDNDQWGTYCYYDGGNVKFVPLEYAPGRTCASRSETSLKDVTFCINGKIEGAIYTSEGGANIYSTGSGTVIQTASSNTSISQIRQNISGDSDGYDSITFIPAKLKNGDGNYLNTSATTYVYNPDHAKWAEVSHEISVESQTEATCTENGSIKYSCKCGYSYTEVLVATGHNEIIDPEVPPTYTTTGLTEGSHCSVCNEVIVKQEVIPVRVCTKHKYTNESGTHCSICDAEATITEKGRTLSYEDYIYVVDIFELSNLDNVENLDLSKDAGILVGTAPEQVKAYSTQYANPGLLKYVPGAEDQAAAGTGSLYFGVSDGIMTRELHQKLYLVGYVKLPNDQYIYSSVLEYSPSTYAYNMIEKYSATPDNNTYKLCVALLNYIASAQDYFGVTETLVTDELKKIDVSLLNYPQAWESVSLRKIEEEDYAGKQIDGDSIFQTVDQAQIGNNLLFEKMISIGALYQISDQYVTPNSVEKSGTIIWTADQWNDPNVVLGYEDTVGTKVPMAEYIPKTQASDKQWCSLAPKLAAKDMADTIYFFLGYTAHTETDDAGISKTTIYYSGVKAYTVEQYISNIVAYSSDTKMVELAKRLYFYERAANAALKSTSSSN